MKNKFKIVLAFILGGIILGGIGVYATNQILASDIDYKNGKKVSDALDDLYNKTNNRKTVCMLISGQSETVGSRYACNPGDGKVRYFYILKVNSNNVELIMEKNITDEVGSAKGMTYAAANAFFNEGQPGYTTKQSWTNVEKVDLPSAETIIEAGGITGCDISTAPIGNYYFGGNGQNDQSNKTNYKWLYNYLYNCVSMGNCDYEYTNSSDPYGYWTKDLFETDSTKGWIVNRGGLIGDGNINGTGNGVRPVITILKSNLSN